MLAWLMAPEPRPSLAQKKIRAFGEAARMEFETSMNRVFHVVQLASVAESAFPDRFISRPGR